MFIEFTKMQGTGNDYIYINCLHRKFNNPAELSRRLSDRRFGIGGDGLVLILPSKRADFRMRIFNADGSEAEICGNAVRCVGKYLYEKRLVGEHSRAGNNKFKLQTLAGIREVAFSGNNFGDLRVNVDMGIPVILNNLDEIIEVPVEDAIYHGMKVSMGNPHFVIFTEKITDRQVTAHGPIIEKHPLFPNKTNVEFARIIDGENIEFRVWERGSGETLSCGSGACAVFAASFYSGRVGEHVSCGVPGGVLQLEMNPAGSILLSGPSEIVFEGKIEI